MLPSEILKGMSREDLHQRYSESVVDYGGAIVWCAGFDTHDDGVHIYYNSRATRVHYKFDWTKMNTERLPARWYWQDKTDLAFYLSYLPARQWRRGYSRGNTHIYTNNGNMNVGVEFIAAAHKQAGNTVINKYTDADLINGRLAAGGDVVFNDHFALLNNNRGLHYKHNKIANWFPEEKKLALLLPKFEPEIREIGLHNLLVGKEEAAKLGIKAIERNAQEFWADDGVDEDRPVEVEAPRVRDPLGGINWAQLQAQERGAQRVLERENRLAALAQINMERVLQENDLEARVREQNRQVDNITAGRNWNDNG
jgi:hypothetical protein